VNTLERDVTDQPWPDAAAEHARRIAASQVQSSGLTIFAYSGFRV